MNPTNVVEMGGAGIDSLRLLLNQESVERQTTEAASDIKSIDDEAAIYAKTLEAEEDFLKK